MKSTSYKISELCEIVRGVSFSKSEAKSTFFDGSLPIIRAGSIQRNLELDKDLLWIHGGKIKENQKIKKNDILMCMSSGSSHLVGKTAISHSDWNGGFGAFCALLRVINNHCLPKYLYYILNSDNFLNWSTCSAGSNIKNIRVSELNDFTIKLPSIDDQMTIVNLMDKVSCIRQKREQAIKLADDFLRAKFLEMFGTPANNIHRFPTGKIRDLVDSVNYGTSAKASIDSGEYPILRMGNITYQGGWDFTDLKYLDLSVKEKDKFLVKEGDLLFNRTNSKELVGKTAVYEENRPMAFAGYLIRVRPNPIGNNYYISGYLNSIHGKITLMNMCKSIVGMANINAQELQNIEILIPPKHLQDEYEIIYKKIKKGLSIYDKSAMQLQLLASNLSNKYFM